jgi:hypothetical protein
MSASEWIAPLLHHAYQTARLAVTFLVFHGASFVAAEQLAARIRVHTEQPSWMGL